MKVYGHLTVSVVQVSGQHREPAAMDGAVAGVGSAVAPPVAGGPGHGPGRLAPPEAHGRFHLSFRLHTGETRSQRIL